MNFFKSILSDDPHSPKPEILIGSDPNSHIKPHCDDGNSINFDDNDTAGVWSFGGLMKTFATRSESVIDSYRRDLQEFGAGLKTETEIFREAASRAVKDLPASLEASASAAHGALDGVLKSTAEIISEETLVFTTNGESETPETNRSLNSGRYSWFESQLSAIQCDLNTFCEEPEDVEEYEKWKLGFEFEEKRDQIEDLIGENGALEDVYKRVVPSVIDRETFWCRYFYRVDKLKQQESVRANLVKRAISVDDDDELSWEVDDEDYNGSDQTTNVKLKGRDGMEDNGASDGNLNPFEKQHGSSNESQDEKKGGNVNVKISEKNNVVEETSKQSREDGSLCEKEVKSEEVADVKSDENAKSEESIKEKNDEKVGVEEKGESGKKMEEDDLGWDEIEDIGSGDEKKNSASTHGGSPNRADLRKWLSAGEDDDDLSWDIEDDDQPVKA